MIRARWRRKWDSPEGIRQKPGRFLTENPRSFDNPFTPQPSITCN